MSETINSATNSRITATLDAKVVTRSPESVLAHIQSKDNPHEISCEQIGATPIENFNNLMQVVDNNSDAIDTNCTSIDNILDNIDTITNIQNQTNETISNINTNISEISSTIDTLGSSVATTATNLENKVDKMEGKGLSTEDFTSELKSKLEALSESGGSSTNTSEVVINKNHLYNPTFAVNRRGLTVYDGSSGAGYCVDRWHKTHYVRVTPKNNGNIQVTNIATNDNYSEQTFGQYIAYHKDFLGKKMTFTISSDKGQFTISTDILPTTFNYSNRNTTFASMETDLGLMTIQYKTNHFYVGFNLIYRPEDTESTTFTLYYAKVEIGDTFTGFENPNIVNETLACSAYYQTLNTNGMYFPGYCQRLSDTTIYHILFNFDMPMFCNPSLQNLNTSGKIHVITHGRPAQAITYTGVGTNLRSKDYRLLDMTFTANEDNTALLGEEESIYEWAGLKLTDFGFQAEIFN